MTDHDRTPSSRVTTGCPQKVYDKKTKNNPNRVGRGGLGRRARNKTKHKVQGYGWEVVPSRHKDQAEDREVARGETEFMKTDRMKIWRSEVQEPQRSTAT
ncbi:hypothetical protein ATANTOWER_026851 [Ataeniobius toweri]|uniref:Uncharacterized protein n=1 Tax=Ataeniobius toweri TaxID=208326 RepID=A0ABU7B460_9TELE|nr:hypothetical protein [Ataeniobius toweri]